MNKRFLLASVVIALVALTVFVYFRVADSRTLDSTEPAIAAQAAPETSPSPEVVPPPPPDTPKPDTPPIGEPPLESASSIAMKFSDVNGRVFDRTTNAGLSGVVVSAVYQRATGIKPEPRYQATTNENGEYTISGLPAGVFNVKLDEVPGYPMTKLGRPMKDAIIPSDGLRLSGIDFALVRSGTLAGRITVNGEPMANMNVLIDSQPTLQISSITSDAQGNYRIEGIGDYSGSLRARGNVLGTRRGTPYVAATIKEGLTTQANFDFIAGSASIVGDIFLHKRNGEIVPASGNVVVTYAYVDGDEYNIENMDMPADDSGHFLVEGLWGGRVTVGVYPSIPGVHRHRYSFVLNDAEQARQDFHFYETRIDVRITRMPADRGLDVWLVAIPGHVETPKGSRAEQRDFVESQQRGVGGVQLDAGGIGKGSIGGLPPGDYTILACAILGSHTLINHAAGEEFYRRGRTVRTYAALPDDTPQISIEMSFPEEP